ncbi:helix-turn-helix transcriptional regulator (plasmid) [Latilactobacillus curvatus]|uniref:Helix-turn-helix transcriptional regulator n=1 Tax=Latilactobacillus curvatus TaxID=28038 RepID=A0AAJ5UR65_LATCU|nr:helix-turn-helix transcriptional regulator [Latilactobacillus curvatus]WDC92863.1 helix-turn-helix transcriptional regulator [Latilactobacillus curvatus]
MADLQLAKRIVNLREQIDMSQSELARRMNMDKSTMNKIENGSRKVSSDELKSFSNLFNVTTDYLLGKSENRSTSKTKEAEITDEHTIMTFEGKPIQPEDLDLIKRLLRGKE